MGRVTEKIKLTNFTDPTKSVEIEALIDTGAVMLALPQDIVDTLGLRKIREMTVRYANNYGEAKSIYGVVIAEMKGMAGEVSVLAMPEGCQALVGQVLLELLDLVVDPRTRSVTPNPRSPDMPVIDMLATDAVGA